MAYETGMHEMGLQWKLLKFVCDLFNFNKYIKNLDLDLVELEYNYAGHTIYKFMHWMA